jgi:Kef-type K+ transport system membrane component KefB
MNLTTSLNALPVVFVLGVMLFFGVFAGRLTRMIRLPALMGFMLLGILLGPSALGMLNHEMMGNLEVITELALGMVALTIGLELNVMSLRQTGKSLLVIVLWESLLTFTVVSLMTFLITFNTPLAIMFGAVAVTTAPAGKVAVIQENNARGPLTRTLLAVVGFDDAMAIIVFGFALAVTKYLLVMESGAVDINFVHSLATPIIEIGLSLITGIAIGLIVGLLVGRLGKARDVFVLSIASIFLIAGAAAIIPISLVLTAMTSGMIITNTQPRNIMEQIGSHITDIMPLMFILFFGLAGAHLDLSALPRLGLVGIGYIVARSFGKIAGCWIGARQGGADTKISRYLGIGILSQAGLAIGLALITLQELSPLGSEAEALARTVIVTITATSVFFELIGPLLTKFSLTRAGETHPYPD